MELTKQEMAEIDILFEQYGKDKNEDKLMKELAKFARPDGSWSLYVRWQLDTINQIGSFE